MPQRMDVAPYNRASKIGPSVTLRDIHTLQKYRVKAPLHPHQFPDPTVANRQFGVFLSPFRTCLQVDMHHDPMLVCAQGRVPMPSQVPVFYKHGITLHILLMPYFSQAPQAPLTSAENQSLGATLSFSRSSIKDSTKDFLPLSFSFSFLPFLPCLAASLSR